DQCEDEMDYQCAKVTLSVSNRLENSIIDDEKAIKTLINFFQIAANHMGYIQQLVKGYDKSITDDIFKMDKIRPEINYNWNVKLYISVSHQNKKIVLLEMVQPVFIMDFQSICDTTYAFVQSRNV